MTTHETVPLTCPTCHGSGDDPDKPWRACWDCHGNGVRHETRAAPMSPAPVIDEPPSRDV